MAPTGMAPEPKRTTPRNLANARPLLAVQRGAPLSVQEMAQLRISTSTEPPSRPETFHVTCRCRCPNYGNLRKRHTRKKTTENSHEAVPSDFHSDFFPYVLLPAVVSNTTPPKGGRGGGLSHLGAFLCSTIFRGSVVPELPPLEVVLGGLGAAKAGRGRQEKILPLGWV